jgi:hypothetical protein
MATATRPARRPMHRIGLAVSTRYYLWIQGIAQKADAEVSDVVSHALAAYAKANGLEPAPPRLDRARFGRPRQKQAR